MYVKIIVTKIGGILMEEVTLQFGLYLVETEHIKLKSDGLSPDEYMCWIENRGICYEDGCLIGQDSTSAYQVLIRMNWVHNHRFFIDRS